MELRPTPQDRNSHRADGAGKISTPFLMVCAVAIIVAVLGWLFRCDLGMGDCRYDLHGLEIEFLKDSEIDRLISAHIDAPCNLNSKWNLSQKISDELGSADLAVLWMKWGSEKNCNMSNADRASHHIEAYSYALDSGSKELADQAINKSLETLPSDPQILLTAAEHHYNYEDKQRAVEFYKLAAHYAGGYQKIAMSPLWTFATALDEIRKSCEALGVLGHLAARSMNDRRVQIKIEKISASGVCATENNDPITLTQDAKNRLLAAVNLDGVSGFFIVDTGASITTLSSQFGNQLGYVASPSNAVDIITANGISYATPAFIRKLTIGSQEINNQTVLISKADFGEIDGLLGMDVLAQFDLDKVGATWTLRRRSMN